MMELLYGRKWTYAKISWEQGDRFSDEDYFRIVLNLEDLYTQANDLVGFSNQDFPRFENFFIGLSTTTQGREILYMSNPYYQYSAFNLIEELVESICSSLGIVFSKTNWKANGRFPGSADLNRIELAMKMAFEKVLKQKYGKRTLSFRLGAGKPIAFAGGKLSSTYEGQRIDCYKGFHIKQWAHLDFSLSGMIEEKSRSVTAKCEIYGFMKELRAEGITLKFKDEIISNSELSVIQNGNECKCDYLWKIPEGFYETNSKGFYFWFMMDGLNSQIMQQINLNPKAFDDPIFPDIYNPPQLWGHDAEVATVTAVVEIDIRQNVANPFVYVHLENKRTGKKYISTEYGSKGGLKMVVPLEMGENILALHLGRLYGPQYVYSGWKIIRKEP